MEEGLECRITIVLGESAEETNLWMHELEKNGPLSVAPSPTWWGPAGKRELWSVPTAGPPAKSHSIYLREAALRAAPRGTKPHCEAPASLGIPSPKPSSEGHHKPADLATSGAQALAALPPCWPLRRREADGRIGELVGSHSTTCKAGLCPTLVWQPLPGRVKRSRLARIVS